MGGRNIEENDNGLYIASWWYTYTKYTHACMYILAPLHTSMHSTYYGCGDSGSISLPLPQGQIPAELGQLSHLQQLHLVGEAAGRCEGCPGSAGIDPEEEEELWA